MTKEIHIAKFRWELNEHSYLKESSNGMFVSDTAFYYKGHDKDKSLLFESHKGHDYLLELEANEKGFITVTEHTNSLVDDAFTVKIKDKEYFVMQGTFIQF